MARTQKNKATNAHLGMLKARLAKLRQELITPKGGGGGGGEGFDVAKTGDARVGFVVGGQDEQLKQKDKGEHSRTSATMG
ncbi:unnamed protein product [Angiostrongylus costaricensis]|uniref:DRG2 n=1 Tax=Angiostrongylus costaricensis TaxID=334426 RepID=A0A0R3PMQ3_ANGCS|nr:unnamed protein product [Angiostrongylus costaricensis]